MCTHNDTAKIPIYKYSFCCHIRRKDTFLDEKRIGFYDFSHFVPSNKQQFVKYHQYQLPPLLLFP